MSWYSSPTPPLRGRLAHHLGRLQDNLDALGQQVRQAVANAVGRSVADVVSETVHDALLPAAGLSLGHVPPRYDVPSARPGQMEDVLPWERYPEPSTWPDAEPYDEEPADFAVSQSTSLPSRHDERHAGRWRQALSAGLQAAAWWLRRHPGRGSLLAALTAGAVTGLTVLAGPLSGVSGVLMSALGLAHVLDLVHSASTLSRESLSPCTARR